MEHIPKAISEIIKRNKRNKTQEQIAVVPRSQIEFPKEMTIDNLNDIEFPKIQKVEITNHKEIVIPEVEFPSVQRVEVINFPKQKEPVIKVNVPEPKIKIIKEEKIIEFPNVQQVFIQNEKPEEYVPVRITDGDKFIEALKETGQQIIMGGLGSAADYMKSMEEALTKLVLVNKWYPADIDETAIKYYGFTDKDGNWYIQKNNTVDGSWRYIAGTTDYPTNWTNRATITYDYYYNIF